MRFTIQDIRKQIKQGITGLAMQRGNYKWCKSHTQKMNGHILFQRVSQHREKGRCIMTELEKFITKCEENAVSDEQIDTSDIPELTEEDFTRGHFKYWRPAKKSITIRIDVDNLAWLQSVGKKDYQSRLNNALRWARMNNCPVDMI